MRKETTYFDDDGTPVREGDHLLYAVWVPTSGPHFYSGRVRGDQVLGGIIPFHLDDLMACLVIAPGRVPETMPEQAELLREGVEAFLMRRWGCTREELYQKG